VVKKLFSKATPVVIAGAEKKYRSHHQQNNMWLARPQRFKFWEWIEKGRRRPAQQLPRPDAEIDGGARWITIRYERLSAPSL